MYPENSCNVKLLLLLPFCRLFLAAVLAALLLLLLLPTLLAVLLLLQLLFQQGCITLARSQEHGQHVCSRKARHIFEAWATAAQL
jgi:hypothetical protein